MHFQKIPKSQPQKNYEHACSRGYCPSLKEIENSEIRELANRIKATSDKETVTNVLEWQDKNLAFWFERHPLSLAIMATFLILLVTSPFLVLNAQVVFAYFAFLVSMIATLSLVAVCMIRYYRKLPLKQIFNIFPLNVPINSILENRLGVCRDYAKLTAALLSNIYPEADIFFAHATNHVATGIMIEKKLYVLDKYLPVTTIDKWHERWHKGEYSEKTIERIKGNRLESVDLNTLLSKTCSAQLDTAKLVNEMKRLLGIHESAIGKKSSSLEILRWKKGAILYEDNEIVNYSLAQRLKNRISGEMLDLNQVAKLEVIKNKDDLIFRINF